MKATDLLVLKDKSLDLQYKQIQYDFENKKINDSEYLEKLKELYIRLLVHFEEVKKYYDSDARLISIKSLGERNEHVKKKINLIIDKYYPQTIEQKKQEDAIREFANSMTNERVDEVFTLNKNNHRQFGVKLTSGASEYIDFDDQRIPLDYSNTAFTILEELIIKNKILLKEWVNKYKENERDLYFFIYDLSALAYFLDQLPSQFQKLRQLDGNYEDLLHDRVIAQLAVQYQKQGKSIDCEILNSKNKNPDLHVDQRDLEVKSIVSRGINHPDHYVRFSKSIRNRFLEACEQIDLEQDMVAIVPWSQIMTNTLKTYYQGMFSYVLPRFKGGKTILLLEGEKPFLDFYLEFPSNAICDDIREFSESGYKRVSSLSYLGSVRRTGFAITRSDTSGKFGMSFTFT